MRLFSFLTGVAEGGESGGAVEEVVSPGVLAERYIYI